MDAERQVIKPSSDSYRWPDEGLQVIPDWVYTSEDINKREMERIFRGRTWNYVGLEAEIRNPGDFKRSYVGDISVIVSRAEDGSVHVFENRCAHRAAEFCRRHHGSGKEFVCPYHQWTYNLKGELIGVPFRRGVGKKGGMPKSFKLEEHGLHKLNATTRGGVIFASYRNDVEPLEDYIGPEVLADFEFVRSMGYSQSRVTVYAMCDERASSRSPFFTPPQRGRGKGEGVSQIAHEWFGIRSAWLPDSSPPPYPLAPSPSSGRGYLARA